MNEKLQYASMLEIPESTCNITYKPIKKHRNYKKKANSEELKQKLVEKVNLEINENEIDQRQNYQETGEIEMENQPNTQQKNKKRSFKLTVVATELIIVGVLIATILLTNIFNENSGLNTLFSSVFAPEVSEEVVVDDRTYQDFKPTFGGDLNSQYQIENGVATMMNAGSVYSTNDGIVKTVSKNSETGLYSVEITHCDNFSTLVEGLDMAYVSEGSQVFSNIPLGYARNSGSTTCFISEGAIISNFEIVDNAVVWAV